MVCLVVLLLPLASQEHRLFFWLSKIVSGFFSFCVRLVRFLKFFSSLHVASCCFVSVYVVVNCLGGLGCWNCCT